MSIRPLILSMALVLCAGALEAQPFNARGAQEMNAVPAVALGPQTVSRISGRTVTVNFGLQPLVHGPYTVVVHNVRSFDNTVQLNGTEISRPDDFGFLEIPRQVTLNPANTLEVTFNDGWPDSAVTVTIYGWKYKYASAYPGNPALTAAPPPDNNPSGPDTNPGSSLDWRAKGAVTPVKNQGISCPASWAFSTTGAVEGYYAIATGELHSFSEQQILDCSGARSCSQGNTDMAFNYVLGAGLTTEAAYPYTGKQGACKGVTAPYTISAFERLPAGNENALLTGVTQQPVSVVINGNWFSTYKGGVANPDCESHTPSFASVLVVGYGYDPVSGFDYWEVKNSLGTSWGESGYFRIVRGVNKCGIADYAMYAK